MRQQAYGYAALAVFCLGISPVALAELKPISDAAMGEVTGQGFMQVENLSVDEHNFTRLTLGMDVQTRVNIDDIRLGQTGDGADFAATHVALGHISRDGSELQYDGQTYAEGTSKTRVLFGIELLHILDNFSLCVPSGILRVGWSPRIL